MKNHTIIINDWGNITIHTATTSKEIADIVLDSGPGAKINIDDKIIWDKTYDETTAEFWDFIKELRNKERTTA